MKMAGGLLVLVLIVAACLCVEGKKWRSYVDLHDHHSKFSAYYQSQNNVVAPPFQYYNQTLNHFDEQDRRTWSQRYLVNDTFWDGKGPVFFMVNGEGPLDPLSVVAYQYCIWAQEFNALMISLEHRFYGESQPLESLSTENLKFLDADQALADAANFRQFIADKYNAHTNQFITFGGSYAGELSGWMRVKFPHLIDASVASSGPVNAEVDFYQYLAVVADSLAFYGNEMCVSNIATATQKIQALTQTASGLTSLSSMFDTCAPITQQDIPNFMQSLAGNFMGIVQYNLEIPGVNISTLCDIMTNSSQDPLSNYLAVWNLFAEDECVDVSYEDMVKELMNTTLSAAVGGRQWIYQSCIEFGYFQTSDSPNQPFGNLFNVSTQTVLCHDVFGFDFLPDVNWTRTEYGANDPEESNILWVNGSIDPWHALGVLQAPEGAPFNVLVINGTAHCADMLPAFPGAPSTLAPAQDVIKKQLATWISNYNSKHI
eukprot:Phypoly_transcript_08342.p1 GENE.Phypoly_transcript_08342~~Phypoly_transcript_08342.p1  ORF type:complete len:486 (+),score=73.44 Phypoly_transcript_08342:64-1521(+)